MGDTQRYTALLSPINQSHNELLLGNKQPDFSSRGHARGTTGYGTTKVSDTTDTRKPSDRIHRETGSSLPELEKRGEVFFRALYGGTADGVQSLLDKIYPDMGEHTTLLESAIQF